DPPGAVVVVHGRGAGGGPGRAGVTGRVDDHEIGIEAGMFGGDGALFGDIEPQMVDPCQTFGLDHGGGLDDVGVRLFAVVAFAAGNIDGVQDPEWLGEDCCGDHDSSNS